MSLLLAKSRLVTLLTYHRIEFHPHKGINNRGIPSIYHSIISHPVVSIEYHCSLEVLPPLEPQQVHLSPGKKDIFSLVLTCQCLDNDKELLAKQPVAVTHQWN